MNRTISTFIIALLCLQHAAAQEKVPILLDVQVENFTDSAFVMVYEKVSSNGLMGMIAGELSAEGKLSKEYKVSLPEGNEHIQLALDIAGPGWERKFRKFYVRPGGKVLVTAQDKNASSIQIQTDSELNQAYLKFLDLTADSREYADLCQHKIDSLVNIRVETDEEYVPIEAALNEWKENLEQAKHAEKTEKLKALQELPFNDCWIEELRQITRFFDMIPEPDLYPLVEETLKTVPFDEKSKAWYIDQLSLMHPGEIYALGDVIDAELEDLDGNSYSLEQFRGKYVLLDFWGEGCGPCDASMPELEALSQDLQDKLVIVSVTQDYNDADWRTATNRHKGHFTWYNLRDKQGQGGLWGRNAVNAMPTFILLSPEGKKADQQVGYSDGSLYEFLKTHLDLPSQVTVTLQNNSDSPLFELLSLLPVSGINQQIMKDTLHFSAGYMEAEFPVRKIQMLRLEAPGKGKIVLPMYRGGHYTVSFNGESFQLEGEENAAQKLYASLYDQPDVQLQASAFSGYASADSLIVAVDQLRDVMREKLLAANKEKKITIQMYSFMQHDIECYWNTVIGMVGNQNLQDGNTEEAEKMWKKATEGVNSYALHYTGSPYYNDYMAMKATHYLYKDMEHTMEMFSQNLRTTAYVNQYKKFVKNEECLENQLAYCLYSAFMQGNGEEELETLYQEFEQLYPESSYLPLLHLLVKKSL